MFCEEKARSPGIIEDNFKNQFLSNFIREKRVQLLYTRAIKQKDFDYLYDANEGPAYGPFITPARFNSDDLKILSDFFGKKVDIVDKIVPNMVNINIGDMFKLFKETEIVDGKEVQPVYLYCQVKIHKKSNPDLGDLFSITTAIHTAPSIYHGGGDFSYPGLGYLDPIITDKEGLVGKLRLLASKIFEDVEDDSV